jgi:UDP-N-acetylglucosamine diphosphorylase / glucose-1-phosphate thymidylyltransferase / UDP-N-acetylgalactosamine diphosphorylase / glucosamine-1-phosphate N-acetyltransferase / galactosamine-1-phosphate N-acetyltransferase
MQQAIVYDDGMGVLWPLTDFRAAFDLRTGARTTLERLRHCLNLHIRGLAVPIELVDLTRQRHEQAVFAHTGLPAFEDGLLLINSRCVLPIEEILTLAPGVALTELASGQVIAFRPENAAQAAAFIGNWQPVSSVQVFDRKALLHRSWHVRAFRDDALNLDLVDLAAGGDLVERADLIVIGSGPLSIHPSAKIHPGVVLDVESGPIVIDAHAVVRPCSTIIGPAYVGQHSTILDRALIKGGSAIGPHCKIAGELGGTIIQGYSNKAHDGHIGDSVIGSWVNLGANTVNSNLLNTYGNVTMRPAPGMSMEKTELQFLGSIIGDHVKTAISTRIMTGTAIGTGAMLAASGYTSGLIPSFAWVTDEAPAGTKSYRLDKFIEVMRAAMARRKAVPTEAELHRTALLHASITRA